MIADIEADGSAIVVIARSSILNRRRTMKIKTNVKAGVDTRGTHGTGGGGGAGRINHNQTVARGLKVKTNVKAGFNFAM
jgi:hypothetical protein